MSDVVDSTNNIDESVHIDKMEYVLNDMNVFVISLSLKNVSANVKKYFANAKIFRAVDLRREVPINLAKSKLITPSGYDTLLNGRKWHKELSSKGAVGLHQSVRLVLEAIISKGEEHTSLLLLEEDCKFSNDIRRHIKALQDENLFDVALIGSEFAKRGTTTPIDDMPAGWFECDNSTFMLTHCTYIPSHAIKKMGKLYREPQEVQIDAFYSLLNNIGEINVWIYDKHDVAFQNIHVSTIQETDGTCPLCNFRPRYDVMVILSLRIKLIIFICFIVFVCARVKRVYN